MSHGLFGVFFWPLMDVFGFLTIKKIEDLVEKKMRAVGFFFKP